MKFLYQNMFGDSAFCTSAFDAQAKGSLYAEDFCPDFDDTRCWTRMMMGPNLETMLIRLTIQNKNPIFGMSESGSLGMEI